jgi:hypothetical protein
MFLSFPLSLTLSRQGRENYNDLWSYYIFCALILFSFQRSAFRLPTVGY